MARAIRAAVSGRPGGVYLDLPAKLFGQVMDARPARSRWSRSSTRRRRSIPAPEAVKRALDVMFERIAHVLLPKDYVRLRLEGEHAIDAADASGTLLFDVAHRRWSDEVLAALDLPREWLPPAHESTAIAGAGDQAAGALGVGIDVPGPLSVALGTSGVVFGVLPSYSADARLGCTRSATPCPAPGTRWA